MAKKKPAKKKAAKKPAKAPARKMFGKGSLQGIQRRAAFLAGRERDKKKAVMLRKIAAYAGTLAKTCK